MNREAWQAMVHSVSKNWTCLKYLSMPAHDIQKLESSSSSIPQMNKLLSEPNEAQDREKCVCWVRT